MNMHHVVCVYEMQSQEQNQMLTIDLTFWIRHPLWHSSPKVGIPLKEFGSERLS
jgi:hypothetical protein